MPEVTALTTLAWTPGPIELVIVAVIGLLIFGKRLPEVGRSIGRGIVEFKRGLTGIDEEIDKAGNDPPRIEPRDQTQAATGSGEGAHSAGATPPEGEAR